MASDHQLPYPNWEDACFHHVFHKAPSFSVGAGTIPPNTVSPTHYHAKPTCIVSTKDTTSVTIFEFQPPNYDESNPKRIDCVIAQGDCFTQALENILVHSYKSTDIPGAFVAIETNVPVLDQESPFSQVQGDGVRVTRKQGHCFWSSQLLHLDPGARATISAPCPIAKTDSRRLGVVLSRLENPINHLVVDAQNMKLQRYSNSFCGHGFEVVVIEDSKNVSKDIGIMNRSANGWVGMLVELFGKDNA